MDEGSVGSGVMALHLHHLNSTSVPISAAAVRGIANILLATGSPFAQLTAYKR
jgi:hypothetical protein